MSQCKEWHKNIVKCIDNEAGDEEQRLVAKHLQVCSSCKEFRNRFAKIRQAFRSVAEPGLPLGIRQALIRKVQADIPHNTMSPISIRKKWVKSLGLGCPGWRWYVSAAAILFIAALGTVCTVLAQENLILKKDLLLARQEVEVLQQQEQLMYTQNSQQKAISELHMRVKELEGHVQLGISPRTVWQPELPYYRPERPGKL